MDTDLAQIAINHAINGNWNEAIIINKQILKINSKDIDALNRLARAYAELGNLQKAKIYSQKVLKLDAYNPIAKKCLSKWKVLKKGEVINLPPTSPKNFLEEPGKTKIVPLLNLGSPKVLAKLDAGDEVLINTHAHRISIMTKGGEYIGRLTDDLSARLRELIKYGNEYQAFIKSVSNNDTKVFLKEVKRAAKLSDIPSFSTEKIDYISFTPPELVHKKRDLARQDFEEE
ncbi:hypothetical protein A2Z22_00370 [Candidatus Woesebacteria bacterium RBG_16_34_12]|uniref:Uncharacterized protein n=1 Tax=Candidatus Woesebacteria bacterium RBG_16_34_12 TaxID=1802480 RepID=A0A1F7X8W5_9BACT|nr:MAG: hypothetical protein A2Z22_00370 [Candidatus Woesebacteria bacterium RBG_16_34_12]